MKVCFHYIDFDDDVSSGTDEALAQWNELLALFEIDEVAVINDTDHDVVLSCPKYFYVYDDLGEFMDEHVDHVFVEQGHGGSVFEAGSWVTVEEDSWLVFGAARDLPRSDLSIPSPVALFGRDAAAVVLTCGRVHGCL